MCRLRPWNLRYFQIFFPPSEITPGNSIKFHWIKFYAQFSNFSKESREKFVPKEKQCIVRLFSYERTRQTIWLIINNIQLKLNLLGPNGMWTKCFFLSQFRIPEEKCAKYRDWIFIAHIHMTLVSSGRSIYLCVFFH